jgi:hypothetical protein
MKLAGMCEALGMRCETHMSGFGNPQSWAPRAKTSANAMSLLGPGARYDTVPPYLEASRDPLSPDGFVDLPRAPGLGYRAQRLPDPAA